MDTEPCAVLRAFLHQSVHIFGSAHPLADVIVIRMPGVMSFTCISLQKNGLSQTVCMLSHALYVIQRSQERVLCLSAEIHGDAPCHQFRHLLRLIRIVHDIAECDGAVLPVDLGVLVHVSRDHDLGLRHLCLCHCVLHALGICHVAVIVPLRAGKSHSLIAVPLFRCCIDTGILASAVYRRRNSTSLMLGVAPHAGAHLICRKERVHVVSIIIRAHVSVDLDQFISALVCIGGHDRAL